MKEISKFLLQTMKKEFLKRGSQITMSPSGTPWFSKTSRSKTLSPNILSLNENENSKDLQTFVKSILTNLKHGEREYTKTKIEKTTIKQNKFGRTVESPKGAKQFPPEGGQMMVKPESFEKLSDYNYIPEKIRKIIENSITQTIEYKFSIRSQEISVCIVYPFNENQNVKSISIKKLQTFFDNCLYKIYLWLYIASLYNQTNCSQKLQINLYLTNQEKVLPNFEKILEQEDINTAFTTSCKPSTVINIYREEEWFKVFIHESFHCLGFDFSHDRELVEFSKQEIQKIYPLSIDILLFETYCEINAEVLNVIFTVYLEKGNENLIYDLLYWESVFSCFQCVKVLEYHKIKFDQLFQKGTTYQEHTNVFCYFVLKALLMMNFDDYLKWFYRENRGSFTFTRTKQNMKSFIELLKYPNEHVLNKIHNMELWYSQKKTRKDFLFKTMRMTIVE